MWMRKGVDLSVWEKIHEGGESKSIVLYCGIRKDFTQMGLFFLRRCINTVMPK